jgi:hypothetical protein
MQKSLKCVLAAAACTLAFNAMADGRIDEVWQCKLKEGKKIEDVHAANAAWVKHMNASAGAGEIGSATVSPITGTQRQFMFVDSYPNLESWAKAEAYQESEAGEAAMKSINEGLEAASDCTSNQLNRVTPN